MAEATRDERAQGQKVRGRLEEVPRKDRCLEQGIAEKDSLEREFWNGFGFTTLSKKILSSEVRVGIAA